MSHADTAYEDRWGIGISRIVERGVLIHLIGTDQAWQLFLQTVIGKGVLSVQEHIRECLEVSMAF